MRPTDDPPPADGAEAEPPEVTDTHASPARELRRTKTPPPAPARLLTPCRACRAGPQLGVPPLVRVQGRRLGQRATCNIGHYWPRDGIII